MGLSEYITSKLIQKKAFTYYEEDIFLIKKVLSLIPHQKPRVLDVGCGNGHFSFIFEKCGAKVTAFDYNTQFIEENKKRAISIGSSIQFLWADGRHPEFYFNESEFDMIFMSGFSLFAVDISPPLMEKYFQLLTDNGKLIFIQNSNQRENIRRTHIRNYSIAQLKNKFNQLNCNIENVFFYAHHISGRLFLSYVFCDFSTALDKIFSRITGFPCNIVLTVSRRNGH